jgi:hypothetical protein
MQRSFAMTTICTADDLNAAYEAALDRAYQRTRLSAFDNHVLAFDDGHYEVIDEGDFGPLDQDIIDRIVHTAPGRMSGHY